MWQHYGMIALDVARERSREAADVARRERQIREFRAARHPAEPRRPWRARGVVAGPVRAFSDLMYAVAKAACTAASLIEGRTA